MIQIPVAADAPSWAHHMANTIATAVSQAINAQKPQRLQKYASTALPNAGSYQGHLIYISTTNRVAYSDGTAWRYTSDEALV